MVGENIFDLSQPDAIEKLLMAAGTTGDPFVPGEPRLTPYGIALEQDFVPTPTSNLPPIVQLAAGFGQSPHLYNVSSFLYPFGFFVGAGRGLLRYRGLEDEAEKRRMEFKKGLDEVYSFCKKQLEGNAGAPEAPAEDGQEGRGLNMNLPAYLQEMAVEVGALKLAVEDLGKYQLSQHLGPLAHGSDGEDYRGPSNSVAVGNSSVVLAYDAGS